MAFTASLMRPGPVATFRRRKKRLENWTCLDLKKSEDRLRMRNLSIQREWRNYAIRTCRGTDRDTLVLIDVWRENHMALRCVKRNHHIYQKMAQLLRQRSPVARSTFEVKNKICNLTSLYRREKVRAERDGDMPTWKYWDAVHDVMRGVGTPYLDSSMVDGSGTSNDATAAVDPPQVEAILSTPTRNEMDSRVPGPESTYAADAIDALLAANEIKQEVSMNEDLNENNEEGCWESNVERQHPSQQSQSSQRKRKYRVEDQRLRIVRLIYEETRRMNSATRRADAEALSLMREQLDLQRRSLEIEERIAGAIERTCQDLSASVRNISGDQTTTPLIDRRTAVAECNGNASSSSSSSWLPANGLAQVSPLNEGLATYSNSTAACLRMLLM